MACHARVWASWGGGVDAVAPSLASLPIDQVGEALSDWYITGGEVVGRPGWGWPVRAGGEGAPPDDVQATGPFT